MALDFSQYGTAEELDFSADATPDFSSQATLDGPTDTGDEAARLAKRYPAPARGGKRSEMKPFVAGGELSPAPDATGQMALPSD
ncbi:MAG: hypothetical protein RL299_207, partial [Pseudomonadota bacterium]